MTFGAAVLCEALCEKRFLPVIYSSRIKPLNLWQSIEARVRRDNVAHSKSTHDCRMQEVAAISVLVIIRQPRGKLDVTNPDRFYPIVH